MYSSYLLVSFTILFTLFEASDVLGGNMRLAAYPPGKGDITNMIRSYITKCEKAGVKIVLNTEVTADLIKKDAPDAVIVATGSETLVLPFIKGITVDSVEESAAATVSSAAPASASLAMACEIGGMTSDSSRLNTEAPHKTPASTRRVAFLLCLVFSEFAFIDVSSPRDRDLALSLSNVSAQSVIAHA